MSCRKVCQMKNREMWWLPSPDFCDLLFHSGARKPWIKKKNSLSYQVRRVGRKTCEATSAVLEKVESGHNRVFLWTFF
jgi:hypothetical protein